MRPRARRVQAVVWKEWLEMKGTVAPWLPGLLMLPLLLLPFFLALVLPSLAGEPLEQSEVAEQLQHLTAVWPAVAVLSPAAAAQALLFQQFLVLTLLVPVSGAMSLCAHSIIGEKQARSLEPLLATPLRPVELLLAKVLAAWFPALALEAAALLVYFAGIAALADPGVLGAMLAWRTFALVTLLGPMAALAALQLVVLSSTRAKDPRSAQQVGVLIVLPLVGVMVAQGAGTLWVSTAAILLASLALLVVWLALVGVSVAAFSRERVLTRWR